jgi:hypothetical protein
VFERLLRDESFVDVTLVCPDVVEEKDYTKATAVGEDKKTKREYKAIKAHKVRRVKPPAPQQTFKHQNSTKPTKPIPKKTYLFTKKCF